MADLTIDDLRRMGGEALYKKYGSAHFSKLGKLSAEAKKRRKEELAQEVKEKVTEILSSSQN